MFPLRKISHSRPRTRARRLAPIIAGIAAAALVATVGAFSAPAAHAATKNPILADGSYYSSDPATLVVDDELYIFAGRDEAGVRTNDFIMNEWQAFKTSDVEGGTWEHSPAIMRPEQVFDWADPGRAYAGQVVEGSDGRFYWYVPVHEAASTASDKFGIGVAVSDDPLGPWTDHAGGPLVSQTILGNDAHNIDPTVMVDDDGRVYMYWGSFGRLMATELESDMKTLTGPVQDIRGGLTGFFEAPWLFKRDATYYLAYAANNAGPTSECTPANYHACIAYSTASSPFGPWTFQSAILAPVSSTTSHPAIVEFGDQWYMAYHTADAEGGNHFRRSVAIDRLEWDDTVSPARMKPVVTTPERGLNLTPRSNVAPWAKSSASNEPIPTQYWIKSLNDEIIRPNPLPPDMWGSWTSNRPPQQHLQYDWDVPVRVDSAAIKFWRDAAPGTGNGVSDPASWVLQYWDQGRWNDVPNPSGYPTATTSRHVVTFDAVSTTRMRAVLNASPGSASPPQYSALAVEEWEVHSVQAEGYLPVEVSTLVGVAPDLPEQATMRDAGGGTQGAKVHWEDIAPADLASPGTITVTGMVEGYAGGRVSATVIVWAEDPLRTNLAPAAAASAEATGAGNTITALNDGEVIYSGGSPVQAWTNQSGSRPASTWVEYRWDTPVRADQVTAHFWSDVPGPNAGIGVAVPQSWHVEAMIDGSWTQVDALDGYPTERGAPNLARFDAVTSDAFRVVLKAQTDGTSFAAVGLGEWEVFGLPTDSIAPEVALTMRGVAGAEGWYLSPVTVRATATDDRDPRTTIEMAVDSGFPESSVDVRYAEAIVTGDGAHSVTSWAADSWGNVSAEVVGQVQIDATAPVVVGAADEEARTVTAVAADSLSGIAKTEYAVDSQTSWLEYGGPVLVDQERHDVYLRAWDIAGNVSGVTAVTVPRSSTAPLVGNIAPMAAVTASYTSGWNAVEAVNDGSTSGASWGTWPQVGEQWVALTWDREVSIDRYGVWFFSDSSDSENAGMIPPKSWTLEYFDPGAGTWKEVVSSDPYTRNRDAFNEVTFDPVTTTGLRIVMQAWGDEEGGGSSGILELEAYAIDAPAPDVTAPIVTIAASPDPTAGWHTGTVDVTIAGSDDSGVDPALRFRHNDGPWTAYAGSISVATDGENRYEAQAQDGAGNLSDISKLTVCLDRVAPESKAVTSEVSPSPGPVLVTLDASDATSGVERIEYRKAGEAAWIEYGAAFELADIGSHEVEFRSVDVAGNVEAARTLRHVIEEAVTPPGRTPSVELASGSVSAGGSLALSIKGFGDHEELTVTLYSEPVALGTIRSDASGAGSMVVTIPAGTPAGIHRIAVQGISGAAASAAIEVTASPGDPVTGPVEVSPIAVTGMQIGAAIAALLLLVAGAGLVAARRRNLAQPGR